MTSTVNNSFPWQKKDILFPNEPSYLRIDWIKNIPGEQLKNKKQWRLLAIPIIFLLLILVIFAFFQKKSPFRTFCDTLFIEEISGDTLSLHYTLAQPEKYNIDTDTVSLPLYDKKTSLANYKKLETTYAQLLEFDPETLSEEEKYTHQLLSKALSHELEGKQYFYLQEVFSPSGGSQLQYAILMAEYPFRSKKDIQDYLELLKLTPSYFESLCDFEEEKVARGFGMADYSLNKVIDQCHTLISEDAIQNNNHFLITTFNERITEALSKKHITKKEADEFAAINKQYLSTYVLPAYENLADTLSSFMGQGKNENGLGCFSDGNAFYEWLFKTSTGSDIPVEKAYKILAKDYYETMLTLNEKLTLFQEKTTLTNEDLSYFPITSSQEILTDLQKQMTTDFPSVTSSFDVPLLPATIKEVSPALEEFSAPAYYMVPPIDDNSSNSIYVNRSTVPEGLELYTTLAHEGYPGHLYQTTYYQTLCPKNDIAPLRNILNYSGYVEGWALYTEFLSYSYAAELLTDKTGNEDYLLLYELYQLERKASLSMLTLLDIGIHYYGMDFDRTKELLSTHGIYKEEDVREIFEYVVEEPANYPKYYWSYLEILSLKEAAKEQMGEYYSDYAFHRFFLECGPSDFTTLLIKLKEE